MSRDIQDTDEYVDNSVLEKVEQIKDQEVTEDMLNLRTADPMEIFKAAAEGAGITLQDPKKNCKKCYGRGFIGRKADTGEPIPCTCIFPKNSIQDTYYVMKNRKDRRHGK